MADEVLEEVVEKPLYMNKSRIILDSGVIITSIFRNETCSITKEFTTKSKTRVVIIGYEEKTDTYAITLEAYSYVLATVDDAGELLFHVPRQVVDVHHIHAKK